MVTSSSAGANIPAFIYLVMLAVWVSRRRAAEIRHRNAIRREHAERFRRRVVGDDGNRRRPNWAHRQGNLNCNCHRCLALHRPLMVATRRPGSLAARRGLVIQLTITNPWVDEAAEEQLRRESMTRNFLDREGFGCKSFAGRWDDGGNEDYDGDGDGVAGVVEGNLDLEFRL